MCRAIPAGLRVLRSCEPAPRFYSAQAPLRFKTPLFKKIGQSGARAGKAFGVRPIAEKPQIRRANWILMTISSFSELALRPELQKALADQGYTKPTPIQAESIPHLLAGRDLLGIAQTGTGKTAAFTLPILQKLADPESGIVRAGEVRALILTPTRELAIQIDDSVKNYGAHLRLRHSVIFGGVGQGRQVDALRRGLDILVATPGRLLDLMNQGHVRFDRLSVFVLDEADRMLDMGFINDVRKIVATFPKTRQTLLFSATMPREIADLAAKLLNQPVRVEVTPQATTVERIAQQVIHVPTAQKRHVLVDLLANPAMTRVIAFTRTKHGANKVTDHLEAAGITTAAIHGNKSQSARQAALEAFRAGKLRVLVATDIAARGIDIDGVSHVVNVDIPNIPESYVHRIGRTARAGKDGIAISLCDVEERSFLRDIERVTGQRLPVAELPPATPRIATPAPRPQPAQPSRRPQGGNRPAQGAKNGAARSDRNRPAQAQGGRRY
jgi:ATP-dependent RNA helicase RhlE